MIKTYNILFILISGMALTQIISVLHLYYYFSNFTKSMEAVKNSGYLLVPNSFVLNQLSSFKNIMCGGFFITITLGAFLTLLIILFIKLSDIFNRRRGYLPVLIVQFILLTLTNLNGLNPVSVYFLVIPPVIYFISVTLVPVETSFPLKKILNHLIPVLILVILFSTQYNRSIFHNIRDTLLLTNGVGKSINTYYYKYTLIPAETIKPIAKKTLKTYRIEVDNFILKRKIKHLLVKYDFLESRSGTNTDMIIKIKNQMVHIYKGESPVIKQNINNFFTEPLKTILRFSRKTDKNQYFRLILKISLLFGFPIALYILISSIINIPVSKVLKRKIDAGGFVCFLAGIFCFFMVFNMNIEVKEDQLKEMLVSKNWKERVSALKYISSKNIEIERFKNIEKLKRDVIPVKYWFTIALGKSRSNKTDHYILEMLNDPDLIIRCKAMEALGLLRKERYIKVLKEKILVSKHWYVQLNGYKALRRTGWTQKI